MQERVGSTLSTEDWGKGILPGTVNKQAGWAGEPLVGAGGARACTATRSRKDGESGGGRKTPQERREDPLST
jgi:hypothetical protein